MSRHEPFEYSAPPPTKGVPELYGWAVGLSGAFVTAISLTAVKQSPRSAVELGTYLITLGLFFGIGMVSKSRTVEIAMAMLLFFGGGIAIAMGVLSGVWFWYLGAVFFWACGGIVLIKDRIIDGEESIPNA
ncbi:MAG TPA: hypothetical protein VNZ58_12530 [Thermomicrobiales bacterium]|nr:hypothetical protein [Thermomicrobiales bacterium]